MATQVGVAGHIIKRPRLTRILDETQARIILLCAPAGYGKTTLAREWVATREEPVLWYSGGPAMADVAALAVDLAELFSGPDSELVERVRFLASQGENPRALAKVLSRNAPDAQTLMTVDDYHLAAESPEADSLFRELVALTQFRVLIGSRVRPAWIDARTVVYREARLVDQSVLAFTQDEVASVIPRDSAVFQKARGWPAVIGLAAANQSFRADGVEELPPTALYDYLASNLFANAPRALQSGLLTLAAGADASRDTARALLGTSYGAAIESALRRGFLVHDERGWIAIHPLLREFLLRQLEDIPKRQRIALTSRVLRVLTAHERWDECLALLERFPDEDDAASVLTDALVKLLAAGRTSTVEQWCDLAAAHEFDRPVFRLARAEVALRAGNNIAALALATEAARSLSGNLAARAHLAAARAAHQLDDIDATRDNAEFAAAATDELELKTEALWLVLMNAYEREPWRTNEYFTRFRELEDPRPEHGLRVACAEAFILVSENGKSSQALRSAERAHALASHVRDPILRTNAHHIRAHLLRVCALYDEALIASDELLELASDSGLSFVADHALLTKAGALTGIRALGRAREAFRQLAVRGELASEHIRRNAALQKAKLRIAAGDLRGAELEVSGEPPAKPVALRAEYLSVVALIQAALGRSQNAQAVLDSVEGTSGYDEIPAYVSLSRAIVGLSTNQAGAEVAAAAVRTSLLAGTADAVVVACRAQPALAIAAVEGGVRTELEAVLSRSRDTDLGRRAGLTMPREYRRRVGLSRREREVYELLVQGRTNIEIAATLFISESTAKVHIRHILEKLGVHSRTEAAAVRLDDD